MNEISYLHYIPRKTLLTERPYQAAQGQLGKNRFSVAIGSDERSLEVLFSQRKGRRGRFTDLGDAIGLLNTTPDEIPEVAEFIHRGLQNGVGAARIRAILSERSTSDIGEISRHFLEQIANEQKAK